MPAPEIKKQKISTFSRTVLSIAGLLLIISVFVPIWRIELDAPQYPEGLCLKISANGLGGNVDIINGLNHYIGMKTLHTEDFVEFAFLPYLIVFFAVAALLAAFAGKRGTLFTLLAAFILFGVVAMVDFWKWEYDYGHHLDPNAAIIVPGMAYQPPLIGFKQLLNFGAYSIPDTGGWLFIVAGLLMVMAVLAEGLMRGSIGKSGATAVLAPFLTWLLAGCSGSGPEPVKLNEDGCDYCKMTIANPKFAAELVTVKGRVYKFDDIICLLNYRKEEGRSVDGACYVCEFIGQNKLLRADSLFFIKGENITSPMSGNIAAFGNADSAWYYSAKLNALPVSWRDLKK